MTEIVVGVDGSEGSRRALEWAYEEAAQRGASLQVVSAWGASPMPPLPEAGTWPPPTDELRSAAKAMVDLVVHDVVGSRSDVDLEATVAEGPPARMLLERARDADMLVVGSRGLGGFGSLMLGSVSTQCAQHATCPTVIVPPPDRE